MKKYDSFFEAAEASKKGKNRNGLCSAASSKTVGSNTGYGDSKYDKILSWDAEVDNSN